MLEREKERKTEREEKSLWNKLKKSERPCGKSFDYNWM